MISFVRMLSAKIWYDTSTMKVRYWHDILFSKLIDDKGLIKQGTACDFFGVDARSNRMKEADRIFERYFETVRIIYNVVEDTLPDAMSGRVQNNIANDFIIRFIKRWKRNIGKWKRSADRWMRLTMSSSVLKICQDSCESAGRPIDRTGGI